jgi:hypothetical protein
LGKALKQLQLRWQEAKMDWDDPRSKELEERFLFPLEVDLRNTVGAMDQMAVLLSRIRHECE